MCHHIENRLRMLNTYAFGYLEDRMLVGMKGMIKKRKKLYPSVFIKEDAFSFNVKDGSLTHENVGEKQGLTFVLPTIPESPLFYQTEISIKAGIHISPLRINTPRWLPHKLFKNVKPFFAIFFEKDIMMYDGHDVSVRKFWAVDYVDLLEIEDVVNYLKPHKDKIFKAIMSENEHE